jgi:hypothetical protein
MLRWSTVAVGAVVILAAAAVTVPLSADPSFTQGEITTRPLIAGQTMVAGDVVVGISGSDLCVFYDADPGWYLQETHLYVDTVAPTKSAPGKFPYKHEYLGGVGTDEFCIPLSEIGAGCGDTVYIAAHAVVTHVVDSTCAEETAWACGDEIRPGKNWAMYFSVTILCD